MRRLAPIGFVLALGALVIAAANGLFSRAEEPSNMTVVGKSGRMPIVSTAPLVSQSHGGGCGSRGGPGYRTASGRCASWREMRVRRHRH